MAEFSELVQALTWLVTNRIQQKIQYTHGLLGDGNGRVRVSTTPGSPEVDYVYVRPDRFSNRTFKVFNKRIEGQDGDPIIIGKLPWEPDLVQVVDMDWATYADVGWGDDVTTTNRHGISHQWRDGAPGIDTFNVYRRQFGDLKTYSTTSGTLAVGVSPYSLDLFGKQYQWPGTQSFSLAGALPTATGTARMNLVYWSPQSGTTQGHLGVATGTLGSGAEATILNRPVSPQGVIPSAFVRLAGGQSSITEFDIWDAREPFRPGLSFSTGSAGVSADMIPIADDSGLYTGSTVEAALDQIGFDGARVSKIYESDFGNVITSIGATGKITIQASVDSADFLKVLDADGGTPILQADSTNENIAIGHTATTLGKVSIITDVNSKIPLVVKAKSGQTALMTDWQDSAGATITSVSPSGILFTSTVSATTGATIGGISIRLQNKNATVGNYSGFLGINSNGDNLGAYQFVADSQVAGTGSLRMGIFTSGTYVEIIRVKSNQRVGMGVTSPVAKLDIDQTGPGVTIPVIKLKQQNVSEDMIEFDTTIGTGNAIEAVGAKALTVTHFIKVTLPGSLVRYIPVGTIA